MHASMCNLQEHQQSANGRRQPWVRGGLARPTKDICGMSLLGEGLQLVVTPAVLSVAVPGMLHHLEKKTAAHKVRRCEAGWQCRRKVDKDNKIKWRKKNLFCFKTIFLQLLTIQKPSLFITLQLSPSLRCAWNAIYKLLPIVQGDKLSYFPMPPFSHLKWKRRKYN